MESRKQPVPPDVALASDIFDHFCSASTLKTILGHFRHMCDTLNIKPNVFPLFYPKLKSKLRSWKAQALWVKFDKRASHKCYNRGQACPNTKVLIIGAGPCGLRTAIEAQLLGAKVVVIEKRDRFSRNNVLHLWPFVIHDLKALGAKKFFGKFCAGSIDHISIRQLQCILMKVALILGVEIHEGVSFEGLVPPTVDEANERHGWKAQVSPVDHPLSQYEFEILIGADGKRNTLEGFKRKEFRGKLAIAITANFINRHTEAEARVEEISGVAFIFNQKFFKDLYENTRIDLENIVYYKDETHYFVMTAKKHSLIDKGVILQDYSDTAKLLSPDNVDKNALQEYAREAADFSTHYQLPSLEFAVNHYGQPDVAMFDFTSMFAAENASHVIERNGCRLLKILVGDSLLEPFWPTGSGCARGFLSSMDACWAIKSWSNAHSTPLDVIAERESIYRLLGQTTPENLQRDYASYTLEPQSRYPNLNINAVLPRQVHSLYDTDDKSLLEQPFLASTSQEVAKKRRREDYQVHPDALLKWLQKQVACYDNIKIENMTDSFKNGLVLCAIIHRYRPDLIDFHSLVPEDIAKNNQLAFDTLEKELGIPPVMTGNEMEVCEVPDKLTMMSYLSQIYDTFRGEIPHIKHPKLEIDISNKHATSTSLTNLHKLSVDHHKLFLQEKGSVHHTHNRPSVSRKRISSSEKITSNFSLTALDKKTDTTPKRHRGKRRSIDKERLSKCLEEGLLKRLLEIHQNRQERERRKKFMLDVSTQQFYKSMHMLQTNDRPIEDPIPFEDYSIFMYRLTAQDFQDRVKDLESKLFPGTSARRLSNEKGKKPEDFSDRVKDLEDKLRANFTSEKKPKDLLRSIGKIEKGDWNVQQIEKKMEENKMGRGKGLGKAESVPKWNRDQYLDKVESLKSKLLKNSNNQSSNDKFKEIDNSLKQIDQKLKEGNVLETGSRGSNKVSAMAEQFSSKPKETPAIQKSNTRSAAVLLPQGGGSEVCHFCNKRVYLMERLSAEGKFFHRGCFRCEYCETALRLENYAIDRDEILGSRFVCLQHQNHHGFLGIKTRRKSEELRIASDITDKLTKNVDKRFVGTPASRALAEDIVDRRTTPERIEFENLSGAASDVEVTPSEMDEDEWTDRNFGASAAEISSDSLSDISDSGSEENENFEEALEQQNIAEETRELAERWSQRYSQNKNSNFSLENKEKSDEDDDDESLQYDSSEDNNYQEYESDGDESETATEGDDDIQARELRKKELCLQGPVYTKGKKDSETDSDTEIPTSDSTPTQNNKEIENSATEIETDSEFEHDGTTPTQNNMPALLIDKKAHILEQPKKVTARTGHILKPINGTVKPPGMNKKNKPGIELKFSPLKPVIDKKISSKVSETVKVTNESNANKTTVVAPTPLINPRQGDYLLNRTHSTEGIASKLSLELKKKYLLGSDSISSSFKKSGSTTTLDSKVKSTVDIISEHQKLLNPAPEPSPTMQAFLQGTANLRSSARPNLSPGSPTVNLPISIKLPVSPSDNNSLRRNKEMLQISGDYQHVCCLKEKEEGIKSVEENEVDDASSKPINPQHKANTESAGDQDESADCRPRSPAHETFIVVPEILWNNRKNNQDEYDIETDSLSSSSEEDSINELSDGDCAQETSGQIGIPRVEIHNSCGELLNEKGTTDSVNNAPADSAFTLDSETHIKISESDNRVPNKVEAEQTSVNSNLSSPSQPSGPDEDSESLVNEVTYAALTETEMSDWAHDGDAGVSEDLDDIEFDLASKQNKKKHNKNGRFINTIDKYPSKDTKASPEHEEKFPNLPTILNKDASSIFSEIDNIEFMDSDDGENVESFNVENKDKINTTCGKIELEAAVNESLIDSSKVDNVLVASEAPAECVNKELITGFIKDEEELSVNPEGNTTEDTSEVTTIKDVLMENSTSVVSASDNIVTPSVNQEIQSSKTNVDSDLQTKEYEEYVQRLHGRVSPFSNVRDSIDIRKSKRKTAEIEHRTLPELKEVQGTATPNSSCSDSRTALKLKELSDERSKQKTLIHEMVLDKHLMQKKQKKTPITVLKQNATKEQFITPNTFESTCYETPLSVYQRKRSHSVHQELEVPFIDSSISPNGEDVFFTPMSTCKKASERYYPQSMHSSFRSDHRPDKYNKLARDKAISCLPDTPLTNPEAFSLPDIRKALFQMPDQPINSPVPPPRLKYDRERGREEARTRARLKSDEELGLSPEDRIRSLKLKMLRSRDSHSKIGVQPLQPERRFSETYDASNCVLVGVSARSKSSSVIPSECDLMLDTQIISSSNSDVSRSRILAMKNPMDISRSISPEENVGKGKKKVKDPDRRKSIIQAVSDFFHKKGVTSPPKTPTVSPSQKEGKFRFKFHKSKSKEKSSPSSNSYEEKFSRYLHNPEGVPPPIPPPPAGYQPIGTEHTSDSWSEIEDDSHPTTYSTPSHETCSSFENSKRASKMHNRAHLQAQRKRLRMAQEIQRQLEEVEVKQRELERQGVHVEKALRGELTDIKGQNDESELLREWFDLVRERNELRRFEKELHVRAEELELEDRHARLQQEFRLSLNKNDAEKTPEDVEKERKILKEMLDIVQEKDSLIVCQEEDRQRYEEEDRDLEAQMLAKGLRLNPLRKEFHM